MSVRVKNRVISDSLCREIAAAYTSGESGKWCRSRFGIGDVTLDRVLAHMGIPKRKPGSESGPETTERVKAAKSNRLHGTRHGHGCVMYDAQKPRCDGMPGELGLCAEHRRILASIVARSHAKRQTPKERAA